MSDAKRTTLATLGPTWMLDPSVADPPTVGPSPPGPATAGPSAAGPSAVGPSALEADALAQAFGRTAPVMLDIGVGTGAATLAWAVEHPDHDVVAVELHRPGIARLLHDGHTAGLTNVRVIEADVTRLITPPLIPPPAARPDASSEASPEQGAGGPVALDHVRVLFPDPWPKKRHVGRRLIDVAFIRQITDLLTVGGTLHLATDWPPYADQMRAVIATEPRLEPHADLTDPEGRWRSHRPDRPVTPYEQRGLDAGRPIADLIARRTL